MFTQQIQLVRSAVHTQKTATIIAVGVLCGIVLELLSLAMNYNDSAQTALTLGIAAITLALSARNLQYGIAIQLVELLTGSKGYLFAISIGETVISLRIALFVAVLIATLYCIVRERSVAVMAWNRFSLWFISLSVVVAAVIIGIANGNSLSTLFQDGNAYLFIGWMVALAQAMHATPSKDGFRILIASVWIGIVLLFLKTFVILFIFSHPAVVGTNLVHIYKWIRDTGVGEITPFGSGFQRVFFQSHIYAVVVYISTLVYLLHEAMLGSKSFSQYVQRVAPYFAISSVAFGVILLSYSRSFWVATACGIGMVGLYSLGLSAREYKKNRTVLPVVYTTVLVAVTACIGIALVLSTVFFPLPGKYGHRTTGPLFADRVSSFTSDSAASSRWQQLPPLQAAVMDSPYVGQGLGATVTYISNDPRVRAQSPDGTYTTFAFEWGYLDMLLKFGVVGTALLSLIVAGIGVDLWRIRRKNTLALPMLFGIAVLCIVHMFTPYLNHPLGIALLCVGAALTLIPTKPTAKQ